MSEEKPAEPQTVLLTAQQVQEVGAELIKALVEDLKSKDRRTAAAMEVARKLLKDSDFQVTGRSRARLVPLTRELPHAPEDIPRITG